LSGDWWLVIRGDIGPGFLLGDRCEEGVERTLLGHYERLPESIEATDHLNACRLLLSADVGSRSSRMDPETRYHVTARRRNELYIVTNLFDLTIIGSGFSFSQRALLILEAMHLTIDELHTVHVDESGNNMVTEMYFPSHSRSYSICSILSNELAATIKNSSLR